MRLSRCQISHQHTHYHSRGIAAKYVEPLLNVGLVREGSDRYRLTFYGRNFKDMLTCTLILSLLNLTKKQNHKY